MSRLPESVGRRRGRGRRSIPGTSYSLAKRKRAVRGRDRSVRPAAGHRTTRVPSRWLIWRRGRCVCKFQGTIPLLDLGGPATGVRVAGVPASYPESACRVSDSSARSALKLRRRTSARSGASLSPPRSSRGASAVCLSRWGAAGGEGVVPFRELRSHSPHAVWPSDEASRESVPRRGPVPPAFHPAGAPGVAAVKFPVPHPSSTWAGPRPTSESIASRR
jgi:hypothetical protein